MALARDSKHTLLEIRRRFLNVHDPVLERVVDPGSWNLPESLSLEAQFRISPCPPGVQEEPLSEGNAELIEVANEESSDSTTSTIVVEDSFNALSLDLRPGPPKLIFQDLSFVKEDVHESSVSTPEDMKVRCLLVGETNVLAVFAKYSSYADTSGRRLRVWYRFRDSAVHHADLNVRESTTVEGLVGLALLEYSQRTPLSASYTTTTSYSLQIADDCGLPDDDFPRRCSYMERMRAI